MMPQRRRIRGYVHDFGLADDGPAHLEDQPRGLVVSPEGTTVFVTGASTGPTGNDTYATVAYLV